MKSILWDFDGTLVDFRLTWVNAIRALMSEYEAYGFKSDFSSESFAQSVRAVLPWSSQHVDSYVDPQDWWRVLAIRVKSTFHLPASKLSNIETRLASLVWDLDQPVVSISAADALEATRNHGLKNIIVTNNYPGFQNKVLHTTLADTIDEVIVSGNVGWSKPTKELWHWIEGHLSGEPPVALIGDSRSDQIFAEVAQIRFIHAHQSVRLGRSIPDVFERHNVPEG
jgi:FMN phosphatase YigB (HAD superfamily)